MFNASIHPALNLLFDRESTLCHELTDVLVGDVASPSAPAATNGPVLHDDEASIPQHALKLVNIRPTLVAVYVNKDVE
jgi:hypothetical protein